jgi:hypothetical protein
LINIVIYIIKYFRNKYFNYLIDFQKNTFWGPGGFGFFLGLFSFSLGIVMIVAAVYIFRRYRQDKLSLMLGTIGEDGYRIMENTSSQNANSSSYKNI